jgi:hypothetical protein
VEKLWGSDHAEGTLRPPTQRMSELGAKSIRDVIDDFDPKTDEETHRDQTAIKREESFCQNSPNDYI